MNARGCYNDCWPGEGNKPIQINKVLAEQLQNATGDDKKAAILAVLMTLLHETVHYGDWTNSNGNLGKNSKKYNTKYGVEAEESEIGKIFEIEAFWGGDYESFYNFKDSDDWNMNAAREVIKRREATNKDKKELSTDIQNKINEKNPNVKIYIIE